MFPEGDQRSIREMLSWLQGSTQSLQRDQLIIACDLDFWGRDGRNISTFNHPTAKNFDTLGDYLQVSKQGVINGAGTYGACTVVDVGSGSKYFNTKTSSAYFTVNASGLLTQT